MTDEQHDGSFAERSRLDKPESPSMKTAIASAGHLAASRGAGSYSPTKPSKQHERGNAISPAFVFGVLRQWWKITIPLGLLLAGLGAGAMWYLFVPMYEASAWLRIEDRRRHIVFKSQEESQRFVATQLELIKSPLVMGPVASNPAVSKIPEIAEKPDPIGWLASQVKVRSVGNSELYVVAFANPDRNAAATVANEVVNSYFNFSSQDEDTRSSDLIKLLDEQRDKSMDKVDTLREEVRSETVTATGKDPFSELDTPIMRDPLSELQMNLNAARVDRIFAEAKLKMLNQSANESAIEPPAALIAAEVEKHPDLLALQADLQDKNEVLKEYESKLVNGKQGAPYKKLQDEIRADEEDLATLRERLQQDLKLEHQKSVRHSLQQELAELQSQIQNFKLLEDTLEAQQKETTKGKKEMKGVSFDLEVKREELALEQATLDEISKRINALETEKSAPQRVQPLQAASAPAIPVELLPWKKLALLSMALFGMPFGLALAWELYVRRVGDADHLERDLQLSVIGEISRLPSRGIGSGTRHGARRIERELVTFEESVDSLRTSLLLTDSLQDMKVIVVTSAISGEGKTSIAVQLAVSLARSSGKRTLLVDADMRSPDIHRLLELSLEPGLSDVLSGECSLETAVQSELNNQLHVLTAGRAKMSPHRLVGNGTLRPTFEAFREQYDYVIIDTAPILSVSEALVLAKHADASLVCAMRDSSRIDQVRRAYDKLFAASGRPVGVVLNGVPTDHYYRRYGSYEYLPR